MNILKHTAIQEEINRYFNFDNIWEFEETEPVKSLLNDMRKKAAQLFDWMVAAKEGSGQPNLHGAILGLKKEIENQREKVIQAVQQLRDRQIEAERHASEAQRRQEEVSIAREANQISHVANEIANRSNGIAEEAKKISGNSLTWAKWAVGVSIIAGLIPVFLHFVESENLEKEVSKQLAGEFRSKLEAELTKQIKDELSAEQKVELNHLIESDGIIQERLNKIEAQVKQKKSASKNPR